MNYIGLKIDPKVVDLTRNNPALCARPSVANMWRATAVSYAGQPLPTQIKFAHPIRPVRTSNTFAMAVREFHTGNLENAETLCLQWLNEIGDNAEAYNLLSTIAMRARNLDKANIYADKAMSLNATMVEPYIFKAIYHKEKGMLLEAINYYLIVLQMRPENMDSYVGLSSCHLALNDFESAIKYCLLGLQKQPDSVTCRFELGNILRLAGRLEEARLCYEKVLEKKIDCGAAWLNLGYVHATLGSTWLALHHFEKAVQYDPGSIDAYVAYGSALKEIKMNDRAILVHLKALSLFPNSPTIYGSLAGAYHELGYLDLAIETYQHAIALHPNYPDAYCNLANVLKECGSISEAERYYNVAISICTTHADSYNNLANIYREQGKLKECVDMYKKALEISPNFAAAHSNIATVLQQCGNLSDAVHHFQKAVAANPNSPDAHCYLGNALKEFGNVKAAIECYSRAVQLNPSCPDFHAHLATAHKDIGNILEAIQIYKLALKFRPNFVEVHCALVHCFQLICDWDDYDNRMQRLVLVSAEQLQTNKLPSVHPHHTMLYPLSPEQRKAIAAKHALFCLDRVKFVGLKKSYTHSKTLEKGQRLRVGYVSSDFSNHPTSHLIQSIPGLHDKNTVEIFCYSLIANDDSSFRHKIQREVDHFIDVSGIASVGDIADIIYKDRINILLNLNGYTKGARNEIFALKPAPVQAMYLGYPGTSGATYMDYIITDRNTSPIIKQSHYSEKFAYMPNSFFIGDHANMFPHVLRDLTIDKSITQCVTPIKEYFNDRVPTNFVESLEDICDQTSLDSYVRDRVAKRRKECENTRDSGERIPDAESSWVLDRKNIGATPESFIYCNFNQLYKLDPSTFACWCRIVKRVPNAVLWLLRFPKAGETNLRNQAALNGIPPERIIFTDVASKEEHVRRSQMADVCLDTPLCNGHTTGMDVLWGGCPIVTLPLATFASRVGSSLLASIGCPELIAGNISEYENLAIRLGTDRNFYNKIRTAVWYGRMTSSLFNLKQYASDFDHLLWRMWKNYEEGDTPTHIL